MPTSRRDMAEIRKRGAGVVAPYGGTNRIRPGTAWISGAFCRVVEDADPYERTLQKALLFKSAIL